MSMSMSTSFVSGSSIGVGGGGGRPFKAPAAVPKELPARTAASPTSPAQSAGVEMNWDPTVSVDTVLNGFFTYLDSSLLREGDGGLLMGDMDSPDSVDSVTWQIRSLELIWKKRQSKARHNSRLDALRAWASRMSSARQSEATSRDADRDREGREGAGRARRQQGRQHDVLSPSFSMTWSDLGDLMDSSTCDDPTHIDTSEQLQFRCLVRTGDSAPTDSQRDVLLHDVAQRYSHVLHMFMVQYAAFLAETLAFLPLAVNGTVLNAAGPLKGSTESGPEPVPDQDKDDSPLKPQGGAHSLFSPLPHDRTTQDRTDASVINAAPAGTEASIPSPGPVPHTLPAPLCTYLYERDVTTDSTLTFPMSPLKMYLYRGIESGSGVLLSVWFEGGCVRVRAGVVRPQGIALHRSAHTPRTQSLASALGSDALERLALSAFVRSFHISIIQAMLLDAQKCMFPEVDVPHILREFERKPDTTRYLFDAPDKRRKADLSSWLQTGIMRTSLSLDASFPESMHTTYHSSSMTSHGDPGDCTGFNLPSRSGVAKSGGVSATADHAVNANSNSLQSLFISYLTRHCGRYHAHALSSRKIYHNSNTFTPGLYFHCHIPSTALPPAASTSPSLSNSQSHTHSHLSTGDALARSTIEVATPPVASFSRAMLGSSLSPGMPVAQWPSPLPFTPSATHAIPMGASLQRGSLQALARGPSTGGGCGGNIWHLSHSQGAIPSLGNHHPHSDPARQSTSKQSGASGASGDNGSFSAAFLSDLPGCYFTFITVFCEPECTPPDSLPQVSCVLPRTNVHSCVYIISSDQVWTPVSRCKRAPARQDLPSALLSLVLPKQAPSRTGFFWPGVASSAGVSLHKLRESERNPLMKFLSQEAKRVVTNILHIGTLDLVRDTLWHNTFHTPSILRALPHSVSAPNPATSTPADFKVLLWLMERTSLWVLDPRLFALSTLAVSWNALSNHLAHIFGRQACVVRVEQDLHVFLLPATGSRRASRSLAPSPAASPTYLPHPAQSRRPMSHSVDPLVTASLPTLCPCPCPLCCSSSQTATWSGSCQCSVECLYSTLMSETALEPFCLHICTEEAFQRLSSPPDLAGILPSLPNSDAPASYFADIARSQTPSLVFSSASPSPTSRLKMFLCRRAPAFSSSTPQSSSTSRQDPLAISAAIRAMCHWLWLSMVESSVSLKKDL
eukprot:TRINITY_DN2158_c0_g1::TRINITY_DN2158_c0_g1_i1::g.12724::m.12724 TRINITY_DN2158_c0_g1::TRINITY_DN2158_c0_g1_i1::g.12724  ORF type:complete len:1197 (-),score=100.12 TRINITY_DN2158_c0_g1_i1:89-3649(-)